MDFERKVGPKGQVVIPRDIRRSTGIEPHALVHVREEGGKVIIQRSRVRLGDKLEQLVAREGGRTGVFDADQAYDEARAERWKVKRDLP